MFATLFLDDEARWRDRLVKTLSKVDLPTTAVSTPDELYALLESDPDRFIRVVLFDQDLQLGQGNRGSDAAAHVRKNLNDRILIGVTSSTDPMDVQAFKDAGCDGMASKAALRLGLDDVLAVLHKGRKITIDQAVLFEKPNGGIANWLVEGREHLPDNDWGEE